MLCKKPIGGKHGCGRCLPCRINKNGIITNRIMMEATLHAETSFLTLTYDDENVPRNRNGDFTLDRDDLTSFWKRLRNHFPSGAIRNFSVGEYGHDGERQFNPHYHSALFGYQCLGKIFRPETGKRCYCERCEFIREVWGKGNITMDELNDTTAAYIGGYVLKKMTNKDDTRLGGRYPEFASYPRGKGLARDAVEFIVDALKSEYGHLTFEKGDIPNAVYRGRKKWPLGRYLKEKIRADLGMEKVNPETGVITYGVPHATLEAVRFEEDQELLELHEALAKGEKGLHEALQEMRDLHTDKVSVRKQRIYNMETKHNIYKSGKVKTL